ncbi:MAG TPA: lipocalin-like domain-containing protein [Gammaproteobacteria bacterium]|nr:lipocalin-like domain-containing protein [Gammaproteobacteria bacterium]
MTTRSGWPRRLAFAGAALLALAACGSAGHRAGDSPSSGSFSGTRFLGDPATNGFARATGPREFSFPADHGQHSEYRTEWWYFTGNLRDADGRRYGFELTFFRIGLAAEAAARQSAWGASQMWMAHFAVTDADGHRFAAVERLARDALGLAGASSAPFRVWVKDWSAEGTFAEGRTDFHLRARDGGLAIDLRLEGTGAPVLQGDGGLDAKGPEPGNASYYYSMPRVAAKGELTTNGRSAEVSGTVWVDREWSTSALSEGIVGWDWFALRLRDGRDLMFYRLRRSDGSASEFSGGSLVESDGITRRRLHAADVDAEALGWWTSPQTAVRYPIRWRLRVPSAGVDLDVEPYIPNQELVLSVRYWEGAVGASGAGGEPEAEGYLELAGY